MELMTGENWGNEDIELFFRNRFLLGNMGMMSKYGG